MTYDQIMELHRQYYTPAWFENYGLDAAARHECNIAFCVWAESIEAAEMDERTAIVSMAGFMHGWKECYHKMKGLVE